MKLILSLMLCFSVAPVFGDSVRRSNLEIARKCRGLLDGFGISKSCKSLEQSGVHYVFGTTGHHYRSSLLIVNERCEYASFNYVNYDNENRYYASIDNSSFLKLVNDNQMVAVRKNGRPTGESERVSCVNVE